MKLFKLSLVAISLMSANLSIADEEKTMKACQSLLNESSTICEFAKGVNALAVKDYEEAKTKQAKDEAFKRSQKAVELLGACGARFAEACFQAFEK